MSEEIKLTLTQEEFDCILMALIVRNSQLRQIVYGSVRAKDGSYNEWKADLEFNTSLIDKLKSEQS